MTGIGQKAGLTIRPRLLPFSPRGVKVEMEKCPRCLGKNILCSLCRGLGIVELGGGG